MVGLRYKQVPVFNGNNIVDIKSVPFAKYQSEIIQSTDKELKEQIELYNNGLIGIAELYYKINKVLRFRKQYDIPPDDTFKFLGVCEENNNWEEFSSITSFN